MRIIKHVPNLITSAGLLSGCAGIVEIAYGQLSWVPFWVLLAGFFDFIDGFAARALKVSSPMGKELDSLSDMVSFGFLPSFFMYKLLQEDYGNGFIPYLAFLIAVASAWRLAYFNIDERQSDRFIGLPTPANAIFITGLIFLPEAWFGNYQSQVWILITLLFSWLLSANVELVALKFKGFGWRGNEPKFILLLFSMGLFIFMGLKSMSIIIVAYILISIITNMLSGNSNGMSEKNLNG